MENLVNTIADQFSIGGGDHFIIGGNNGKPINSKKHPKELGWMLLSDGLKSLNIKEV